jgi:thioredoxin-dependent peroxiredoxin
LRYLTVTLALTLALASAASDQPAVGSMAPDFRLQDQDSEWHSLADYQGQWVALYFYPKADTPGCTTEACNFRDDIMRFRSMGVAIVGVSLDDVESQQAFAEKYSLPFPLLSDREAEVADLYGVRRGFGPIRYAHRETFLIDPSGRIAMHYDDVDPDTHSAEVMADLERLMEDAG